MCVHRRNLIKEIKKITQSYLLTNKRTISLGGFYFFIFIKNNLIYYVRKNV